MNNDRKITITTGASRKSTTWLAQTLYISELYEKLSIPARGTETQAEYFAMKKDQQAQLKDVGGFVAGTLRGQRRKGDAITGRDVLTLDLDNLPAGSTENYLRRLEALGCGYCVYSTRKHTPGAPRLRVLFPLDRTVTADEYEPCARRIAHYIDPGMTPFDPTTFEASRLMYWPSCSADAEYIYQWADKPLLSADGLLKTFADWRDMTAWPQVPGAQVNAKRLSVKQGDPAEKPGVVGAFCRIYDIYGAMDAFLPGLYEPVDNAPGRYTFTGGTTTGGAVVYDEGKFLYSHHATDPCSGKLVNAFDLVRLNLFDDLDAEAKPETPVNKLPSYLKMTELAMADTRVAQLVTDAKWERVKDASATGIAPPEDDGAWRRPPLMDIDGQGNPQRTLKNFKNTFLNAPQLKGKLRRNLFSGRIDVEGDLPWERIGESAVWSDDDINQLRIWMEPYFGKCTKNDVIDAVAACARVQAYHPVQDYLNSLIWDGIARLDALFIDYLGAADTPYTRNVTRKSFVAAVARAMRPGCKYDTMPVLIGGQGRHKSTILAKMGGAWFSDSLRTFDGKDAMETIQGTWINEIAEMQAMNKTDINAVKAFLSKTNDYYREAYGRYASDRSRQCVFFGTTNSRDCLVDTTGGRRFLPIDIDQQSRTKNVFADLDSERDQLWAEAVHYWKEGESLHLSPELEAQAKTVQEDHRQRHPWEGIIAEFLERPIPKDWNRWDEQRREIFWSGNVTGELELVPRSRVCAAELWCEALKRRASDLTKAQAREINNIMEIIPGWVAAGVRKAGKPYGDQRCFARVESKNTAN